LTTRTTIIALLKLKAVVGTLLDVVEHYNTHFSLNLNDANKTDLVDT
jgi:hypothetical protein